MFRNKKLEAEGLRKELNELRERIVKLELGYKPTVNVPKGTWRIGVGAGSVAKGIPTDTVTYSTNVKLNSKGNLLPKSHTHTLKPYYSRKKCTECGHITRRYNKRQTLATIKKSRGINNG